MACGTGQFFLALADKKNKNRSKPPMVAHIKTVAFQGVDVVPIDVQVHLARGQNAVTIGGSR